MTLGNIWKSCRMHAKLAENQIGLCLSLAGITAVAALLDGFSLFVLLGGWIPMLLSVYLFSKTCRIVFGQTTYEADGCFVRCMPLTEKELLGGKLLIGTLTGFGMLCFFVLYLLGTLRMVGYWDKHVRFLSIGLYDAFELWELFLAVSLEILVLLLLSACIAALESIAMSLVYRRREEKVIPSVQKWPEAFALLLPLMLLLLPFTQPEREKDLSERMLLLPLIKIAVLAVLLCLLVKGAYRVFSWGTAEYHSPRQAQGTGRKFAREQKQEDVMQGKNPEKVYACLLRENQGRKTWFNWLWTGILLVIYALQGMPYYLLLLMSAVIMICAQMQYEKDNAMLYGENAAFYQLFPLKTEQKVRIHTFCGQKEGLLLLLLTANGFLIFRAVADGLPQQNSGEIILQILLLNAAVITGALLCAGMVLFCTGFGNQWRDPITRVPSRLAGNLLEFLLICAHLILYAMFFVKGVWGQTLLLGGITILQTAESAVFYRLNIWMLEKRYAI